MHVGLIVGVFGMLCVVSGVLSQEEEEEARDWYERYDLRAQQERYTSTLAAWNFDTNITDYNQKISDDAITQDFLFFKEAAENASSFQWKNFKDVKLKRLFRFLTANGTAFLDREKFEMLENHTSLLSTIYSTAEVCEKSTNNTGQKCQRLDPDLSAIFATSRDWDELLLKWKGWRDVTGKRMIDIYTEYVNLSNQAAVLHGYSDNGELWRAAFEMDGFEAMVDGLWRQVAPLYHHLHAFVRGKLQQVYMDKPFPPTGHIPAHILGNMWAQEWNNIGSITMPFPNKTSPDITGALLHANYTALDFLKLSDDFFKSLGLAAVPDDFYRDSMIERPRDGREVVCHASAWDFLNGKDYRIKQCTGINLEWLITTHHEMGHIQYYIQYKDQPFNFRDGANPGFHEAIGDVIALSVSTPEHLHQIGLVDSLDNDNETDLNFLMSMALSKVAFLPFGYLVDKWRWDIFSGRFTKQQYNERWWQLRCQLQGISPPLPRSDTDFDPGAKFHIANDVPYIRYFIAFILQFHIHKSLCEEAGNTKPLHRCDIYNSTAAGHKLGDMLKLGSSIPWQQALKLVTGNETMDAAPLMEYFKPLYDWLKVQNKGVNVGWEDQCTQPTSTDNPSITTSSTIASTSSTVVSSPKEVSNLFFLLLIPPLIIIIICLVKQKRKFMKCYRRGGRQEDEEVLSEDYVGFVY